MNKKVLALGVAAVIFGAPVVASANANLTGGFVFQLRSLDGDVNTTHFGEFYLSGSEDIGNGLTGVFNIGAEVNSSSGDVARTGQNFVGLRGGFGTVLLGQLDHPYRSAGNTFRIFGDTVGMVGTGAQQSLQRVRSTGAVAWVSPNLNGLTLSAATVPLNDGAGGRGGDNQLPYSMRAAYTAGPVFVTAAYEDLEDAGAPKAWLVGGRYNMGGLSIGVMYEDVDTRATRLLAPITYTMGNVVLRASVMMTDPEGAADEATDFAVGLVYNLSSRTNVRLTGATEDDNDKTNFGVTVAHSF